MDGDNSTPTPRALPLPPAVSLRDKLGLLRDPYAFFSREGQARYGDIFILDGGLSRVTVLNHPALLEKVLRTHAKNYVKEGVMWDGLRELLGDGLIISQGDTWRTRRRMMQPHFGRERLANLTDTVASAIDEVVDTWSSRTHEPLNMKELCPHMTMLVMVKAVFGTHIPESDVQVMGTALAQVFRFLVRGLALDRVPDWLPLPGRAAYQASLAQIDEVLYRVIERRRSAPRGDDLLSMLLELRDEHTNTGLNDKELHDEVINLFLAGYETTATGMAWAFNAVAQRPAVARRVYEEVSAVTGGVCPRFEHLAQLSYTRMVIKEAFRRYPPAWQIMRTALADDELGGFHIPAGSQLMLSLMGAHLHPEVWPDPLRFDPMRHTPEASAARPRSAWMPFGSGQRMCIGIELSMMESVIMLAEVVRKFELSPVPGRAAQPKLSMVTDCEEGIWLNLRPR